VKIVSKKHLWSFKDLQIHTIEMQIKKLKNEKI
jgi:hypothetical protein